VLGSPESTTMTEFTKSITQPGNEGATFRFRVAAENELGVGPYSREI